MSKQSLHVVDEDLGRTYALTLMATMHLRHAGQALINADELRPRLASAKRVAKQGPRQHG